MEEEARVLAKLSHKDSPSEGVSYTQVRTAVSLSGTKIKLAVERLVTKGQVEWVKVEVEAPRNRKRLVDGLRLRSQGSPGSPGPIP